MYTFLNTCFQEDEAGVTPLIKVWDWSRVDRHGNPQCVRTSRAVPSHMYPTQATALAVHDNKVSLKINKLLFIVIVF